MAAEAVALGVVAERSRHTLQPEPGYSAAMESARLAAVHEALSAG
jgi:hypothetical protein